MKYPTEYEINAGTDAVTDISSAMMAAAGEGLKRHGPDPNSPAILSAAFCLTVDKITAHIDPNFKTFLLMQLGSRT